MSNLFVSNRTNLSVFLRFLFVFILVGLPLAGSPSQGAVAAPGEPAQLEPAPVFVATPTLTLGVPSTVPLGSEFTFTATFTNTGAPPDEVGYGPFIDLVFPATGMDGVYPGTDPDDLYDGVTFVGASFMGIDIDPSQIFVQTFPDDGGGIGCVQHPIAVRPANDPPPPANPNLPRYYQVCGNAGDQFVTIILPFGSFVPSQPPATVTITAQMSEMADLDAPLTISGQAGFQFGYTPLNDFCCSPFDATIPVQPGGIYDSSTFPGQSVAPTLMSLSKTYIGPENETATGPNFPRQYTITVDIADGQPVSGLTITDTLPNNIQYVSLDSVTVGGVSVPASSYTIVSEPLTTTPGGTLEVELTNPVVGGDTVELTFTFYVDRLDASSAVVLNPVSGAFTTSTNTAEAEGTWDTPLDSRDVTDPLPTTSAVCPSPCVVIEDQSLAIQKGVANITDSQNNPGDVLEYTLSFQISDFFGFQSLVISDVFTDGQRFDSSFVPRLTVNGNGYTLSAAAMNAANYDVACDYTLNTFPGDDGSECTIDNSTAPNTGETTLTFRISDEIITRGQNGQLLGGCVDPTDANNPPVCSGVGSYNDGPTTGTLTFRTVIQDQFSDLHDVPGNGDASVDHGDVLGNTVNMSGTVLNIAVAPVDGLFGAQPDDPRPSDNSGAGVSIAFGELQKRIYAVNGSTSIPTFLAPGDVVTYRLTYTQPSSDFEETTFTDYLPLPVFDATELTTLNNTICGIPSAGLICLGPADNYHNLNSRGEDLAPADPPGNLVVTPTFATNGPANRLTITYAAYDSIYNISSTIDILFSVTVTEDPFADGLFLTNQVTSSEGTTNAGFQFLDEIVQIRLGQPVLRIGKTAVSSDHVPDTDIIFTPGQTIYDEFRLPGNVGIPFTPTISTNDLSSQPNNPALAFDLFNGVMEGVDNNDLVKYAIIIENKGSSPKGAYDIAIQDILPTGMAIPAGGLNLQIYNGAGDEFGFEVVNFVDGIYGNGDDTVETGDDTNSFRIFDTGYAIRVVDPNGVDVPGACQVHSLTSGANIIVITYDLLLADADTAGKSIINTASLIGYSGTEGGPNYLPDPLDDDAEIITNRLPGLEKRMTGTDADVVGYNEPDEVVIGEIITYQVKVKFFELKTPDAVLVDTLDPGLAFVNLVSVVNSDPDALDIPTMTFDSGTGECDITDIADGCFAGTNPALHNPVISDNGGTITFDFGDVVNNTDTNNLVAETITITYRAVVLNVIGNQQGTQLNNSATLTWTNDSEPTSGSQTVSAENVTVIEPDVTIQKDVNDLLVYDAGDPITYTFVITGGVTIAYDLTFSDPLPEYFIPDDIDSGGDYVAIRNLGQPSETDITSLFEVVPVPLLPPPPDYYLFQTTSAADIDLEPGETIHITINGTISIATPASATLENTAIIEWTSLDGDVTDRSDYNLDDSDERTGADGEPGPGILDDYHRESTIVTTVTTPLVLVKSIVATSEAHTLGTDVAIGEIVRFRLVVRVPEGTNVDLVFEDDLPHGLTFLDDGSARIAFVCSGAPGCMTSSNGDLSGLGLIIAGDENNIADITPTFVVPGSVTSTVRSLPMPGAFATGDTVYFRLDTVVNSDNDPSLEYVVIEFNALVDNSVAGNNNNGDTLENFFIAFVGNDQSGDPSNTVSVTVREPEIDIAKSLTAPAPSNFDAGDTVSFTVIFENIGTTYAFDIVLTDDISTLPLTNLSVVSATADVTCVSPGTIDSSASTASNLLVTVDRMSAGCEVTVVYTAVIEYSVNPQEIITNTARVTWTSLPGTGTPLGPDNETGSTTPGGSGTDLGERIGTDPLVLPNDYIAENDNSITIDNVVPVKSIIRTSEAHTLETDPRPLAIGEIITYRLAVQIPEGTSSNFTITDVLPTGFTFIDGTLKLGYLSDVDVTNLDAAADAALTDANDYASAALSPTFDLPAAYYTYTSATRELLIELQSPVNNDSDADAEYIVVEFNVLVNNTADNNNTDLKNNNFTVEVDGNETTSNTVVARIDEPNIIFNSTANNKTASPATGQDAGNTINYTVTYTNTGTATAFDVRILDNLNATYLDLTIASVLINVSDVDCAAPTVINNSNDGLNRVDITVGSVPVNCTVVITYSAVLTTSVVPNQSYINTANLTYTSLPGDNGTGDVTPGTPGSDTGERTGGGGVNDYSGSDTASVSIDNGARIKTIVATSEAHTPDTADGSSDSPRPVAIGEIVRYRLVYQIPEGTVPDFNIRDRFAPTDGTNIAGQKFIPGSARFLFVGNGGVSSTTSGGVDGLTCTNDTGTYTLAQAGSPASIPSSSITCSFADSNISSAEGSNNDVYLRDVYFKFGNLNNFDPTANPGDLNLEFVIIEFDALVDNNTSNATSTNDDGDVLQNTMQARYRNPTTGNMNNLESSFSRFTIVREPLINNLDKSVTSSGPYEAGSTVSYQLTYSNTGSTDAFDVQILDSLNSTYFNLTLASVVTDVSNAQCAAVSPTVTNASLGNTVDVTVSRVPVGCQVIITYSATLTTAVNPDVTYDNTADLTYTSLPGTGTDPNPTLSSTPGGSGAQNGERDGSNTPAHNDYNDTDDAQITIQAIQPVKSIVATSEAHTSEAGDGSNDSDQARLVTVGEILRYRLVIQIPEGTSNDLIIEDQLTTGILPIFDATMEMTALNFSAGNFDSLDFSTALEAANGATVDLHNGTDFVFTTGNGYSFDLVDYDSGTNLLTFNLGDIVNLDLNDADAEFIQIDFNVLVTNTAGVEMGDILSNTFRVQNNGGDWAVSNTVYAEVVEPQLEVDKSADDTVWEYGQTPVTYTIAVAHTAASTADAFDIVVTDTIPAGLTYNPGSITAPAGWVTDASAAPTLTWTCSSTACSMPLAGGPVSLTYTVTVNDQFTTPHLMGDDTAVNTAVITWTSLPGTGTTGNPTGSDTPGDSGDEDGERDGSETPTHNDYTDSDTETGGLVEYYSIGNRVWFDTDNDGTMDAGEQPVPGVLVQLYDAADLTTVLASDVTNADGFYLFDYLVPGDYVVVVAADNFDTLGTYNALVGYWSSGTTRAANGSISEATAPNPETDATDADDNGELNLFAIDLPGAVAARAVTLGPSGLTEPTGEVAAQLDPVEGQGAQPDGRANMTVDFGFYRVEIGNLVYRDENVNGTYDSGTDTLLENVTVELLSGNGLTVLATTTTNALGEYRFSGLPEGDYIVRVTTPDDHVSTIDTFDVDDNADPDENTDDNDNGIGIGPATVVNVQSGVLTMTAGQGTGGSAGAANNVVTQNSGTTYDPTLDFGFTYAYALGNRVWFDTNNDSQIGFGTEVGVDGVTVELYAASDLTTLLATDTTANGGYYLFDYLTAGDYVVAIPASNFAASAVLEGYWSSATYRDTSVPYDILETAAPDPDDDVDSDDNGTLQNSGVFSGAVVSLPVTLGPGIASEPNGETDLDGGSQGDQPNGRANMTVDFGFYKVSVGNLVWADADRDGEYDSGEPLLQGVTVNLYAQDGTTLIATTTTDIDGVYAFDGLPEGTYVISVIAPAGTFSTIDSFDQDDSDDPNENTDDNDNGVGLGGGEVFSNPVTLTPGDDGAQNENDVDDATGTTYNPTLDFGFTPVYSLGNRVWYDTNNNRAIDFANELGIDGVRVQLFDTSGNEIEVGLDGILGTADDASGGMLTDNGGYYLFNGLEAGEYVVVLPASNFAGGAVLEGYWSSGTTRNNDASLTEISAPDPDNDVDSDDNGTFQTGGTFAGAVVSLPVTLGPTFNEPLNESDLDATLSGNQQGQPDAQANMTVDFGFYTIRLGNQVWNDLDNNGLLDGAEAGINGVTVELWSADGLTLLATTTTQTAGADDGVYTFTGLPQGNYIVRLPEGNFLTTGVLRDFYSSTGGAGSPYEPAPNPDVNLTDSDDNGSEAGTLGFPGGYIQSGIFALTPAAEQWLDHSLGLTTEFRVDFGVFNSPQVDLAVTKDDGQTYYLAGGTLVYEIVVTNNGPADVSGALVSDPIPAQIASWSWACTAQAGGASGCTPYAGTGDFTDTVDLPLGDSITYTVTATIASDAVGTLTNNVTVAPPSGYTDTNDTNDEDSDVNQPASLTITKDDGRTVVAPGSVITYTIELTNNGAVDLTTITVEDTLPADVTYQSAVPAPDLVSGGVVTWENISLASGENTFFSVTVQVVPEPVGSSLTNTVTANDTDTGLTDSDDDTDLVAINNGKLILDTNEPTTATPSVAIGEIVTYQISIDIPALGTLTNLQALDVLDFGLAFVRCVNIDPGSLTTTLAGGFADACNDPANPVVMAEAPGNPGLEHQGRRVLFNFGDVANPDATDARLIVEYEVVVLNVMANQDGVGDLNNSALWTWDGGSLASEAPPLEIVEPDMAILKDASPTVAPYGATINFTLDIAHTIDSTADAFDVVVTDILPPGLAFVPGSVSTTGLPPTSIDYDAPGTTLTFTWDHFPLGETAMLSFQLTFIGPAPVTNTADLAWTSLPIDPGLDGEPVQQSDYNDYSTERWYDPPDTAGVNTYGASSSVSITIPALPATGFAPGRVSSLPAQPVEKAYSAMDGIWLEIPDLGLTLPITGVPIGPDGWDLTWLTNQAGYLQGTTLPGDVGTTGLTAHVTLADGTPGPFRNLNRLYWGNKIILHADGYRYVYEVRESRTVLPRDLSVLKKDGYTWLTLITCEGYVPWLDSYNYRLAVRAVLLSVEPDTATSPFAGDSPPQQPPTMWDWINRYGP